MNIRIRIIVFSVVLMLCAGSNVALAGPGTLIYDNGAFVNDPASSTCLELSTPQDASYPTDNNATLGTQSFWLFGRIIEDFTVPPGAAYSAQTLRWRIYQSGTLYDWQLSTAFVRLWTTDPILGGSPLIGDFETNRIVNTTFADALRTPGSASDDCSRAIKNVDIDISDFPALPAGQYWIEVGFASDFPGGLFSPPTEPRLPTDRAYTTNFSGDVEVARAAVTGNPLEYPFQLFGEVVPPPLRACVLENGTCLSATLEDCTNLHGGTWNYAHPCGELGACCNHADGSCVEFVSPEDCTGSGRQFAAGAGCAALPGCGLMLGACCNGTSCTSFQRGIQCSQQGGSWRVGSCTIVNCNDACASPTTVFNGMTSFDNFGYTTDGPGTPNDCGHDPFVGRKDAWFRYVSTLATFGGDIEISLCLGTSFDATLEVFNVTGGGAICEDLRLTASAVFCDNDGCGIDEGPSYLVVPANPGDEFLIRIGGYDDAEGGGTMRITPIEAGYGACCSAEGLCEDLDEAGCLFGFNAFFPHTRCDAPDRLCPQVGACCRGAAGCAIDFENLCTASGGTFIGGGTVCGQPGDCDNDGETDFCEVTLGAADCNANGIPDDCDIGPFGASTDCNGNLIPDECDVAGHCCVGDANGDATLDGRDIQAFIAALFETSPACFSREFCRLDTNGDFTFDLGDVDSFVEAIIAGEPCPILIHVSGQVNVLNEAGQLIDVANEVFLFNEVGQLIGSYDQLPGAAEDSFGYRDGASDGSHVYFGWSGGVLRHDADGSNGIQIIFGSVPGTGAMWRALAYDPTGDNGNGSFWTQSFISDLVETDLFGNPLHQFPNDFNLYGLAYDRLTGRLWGHDLDGTNTARIVEIDTETGLGTGVEFPSHFNVPGGSNLGFGQYGGLSFDDRTGTLYGLLQAVPSDAIFHIDTNGNLLNTFNPNPRNDIDAQTGTIRNLGITYSRP